MASRMSREVVRPISPTGSVDFHVPTGRCRTKPWSNCTGPPKNTGSSPRAQRARGISTWRKRADRLTSMGRFTTIPSAPRSLCSQTKVRVREKFGSDIAGMAMRKWLVRLIVCMTPLRILPLLGEHLVGAGEGPGAGDVKDVGVGLDVLGEAVEGRGEPHDADRGLVEHALAGGAVDLDRFDLAVGLDAHGEL